jgi:signal transduction histidine kinase
MDDTQGGLLLIATSMIVLVTFALTVLAVMLIYRKRRVEYEHKIALMNEKFAREVLQTQVEVQQTTMQHIGQEIHDNVGQQLTLAFLYIQQLGQKEHQLEKKILDVAAILNDALTELRNLSRGLIDVNFLNQTELSELIKQECNKVQKIGKCIITHTLMLSGVDTSPTIKIFVIRILQEFLQNSLRHSDCSTIHVELRRNTDGIMLLAKDNGVGYLINNGDIEHEGIGLRSMKKRAQIMGAELTIESAPGEGTQMSLFVPINKLNQEA